MLPVDVFVGKLLAHRDSYGAAARETFDEGVRDYFNVAKAALDTGYSATRGMELRKTAWKNSMRPEPQHAKKHLFDSYDDGFGWSIVLDGFKLAEDFGAAVKIYSEQVGKKFDNAGMQLQGAGVI